MLSTHHSLHLTAGGLHAVAAKVPVPLLGKEFPHEARLDYPLLLTATPGTPLCERPLRRETSTAHPPLTPLHGEGHPSIFFLGLNPSPTSHTA
jgi:hypothetical protein